MLLGRPRGPEADAHPKGGRYQIAQTLRAIQPYILNLKGYLQGPKASLLSRKGKRKSTVDPMIYSDMITISGTASRIKCNSSITKHRFSTGYKGFELGHRRGGVAFH